MRHVFLESSTLLLRAPRATWTSRRSSLKPRSSNKNRVAFPTRDYGYLKMIAQFGFPPVSDGSPPPVSKNLGEPEGKPSWSHRAPELRGTTDDL